MTSQDANGFFDHAAVWGGLRPRGFVGGAFLLGHLTLTRGLGFRGLRFKTVVLEDLDRLRHWANFVFTLRADDFLVPGTFKHGPLEIAAALFLRGR
jgi:hypothetical protein